MHDCKALHIYVWELELACALTGAEASLPQCPLSRPMQAAVAYVGDCALSSVSYTSTYRGAVLPQASSAWGTEDAP